MTECNEGRKANQFYASNKKTIDRICKEVSRKYAFRVLIPEQEKCLDSYDLEQEALMRVLLKADSFESTRAENGVEGFIYHCAKTAILDAIDRYKNRPDETSQEDLLVDNDAFSEQSLASELLDHLPVDRRLIVELKYGVNPFCEHSDECIAKELGLSRPTVKKEINRALHEMRQYASSLNRVRVAA